MRKLALTSLALLLGGLVLALWWTMSRTPDGAATIEAERATKTRASLDALAARTSESKLERAPDVAPSVVHATTHAPADAPANEPVAESTRERAGAEVRLSAHVWGTVRDRVSLRPVPDVQLSFTSGGRPVAEPRTLANGRFQADFEALGTCSVAVTPPEGWVVVDGAGVLRADVLDGSRALEIHVRKERGEVAGDIHGYLLSESGEWTKETLPKPNSVMVDLVPTREPRTSLRGEITPIVDSEGRATLEFVFRDVPPGEHELTVSALDGFRWAPQSLRVSPPADGLSFVRYDKDRTLPLVFEVFDARTREAITAFKAQSVKLTVSVDNGVFMMDGPLDLGRYSIHEPFEWSVTADDYGPAYGNETAFTTYADRRVAQVYLTHDWATRVLALVRDPAAKPAINAEVYVDGKLAGRTRADGVLIVRSTSPPERLEVRVAGFRQTEAPEQVLHGAGQRTRNYTTIVFLERER